MRKTIMIKKGQAEFFGLVIIVFLLSIGLILMIGLKNNQKSETIKSSYFDQSLAQNTINSMLDMRTECKIGIRQGITLIDLIVDCASGNSIQCDNSELSCEYANRTISILLNETLKKWNKPYFFNITRTSITFTNLNCTNNKLAEVPGTQPFPLSGTDGLIYLRICKES